LIYSNKENKIPILQSDAVNKKDCFATRQHASLFVPCNDKQAEDM